MLELGNFLMNIIKKLSQLLLKAQPRIVITVGNISEIITKNLPKNIKTFHFKKVIYVYNKLIKEIKHNDVIMIKGSNSIKLSLISKALCEEN